jgi:sigma-B regulation protein RsbQ
MTLRDRHNIHVVGSGDKDMILLHGYGCDQNMWRLIAPAFEKEYRIVLYDLVGSGKSDLSAYDRKKYSTLNGHAQDLLAVTAELTRGPAVFVGHSVSAMIGLLAGVAKPSAFAAHVMVAPSPCYINDGDYHGGFERSDIDSLLDTVDSNYLGWASAIAPKIMGAPDRPQLGEELTNSFCRTDPEIAKHFARVTFTSDNRADVPKLKEPTLVLQCSDDIIAPRSVGDYLHRHLPKSTLALIDNIGHCPHLSAPEQIIDAMRPFLQRMT